jgi:AraC family transcriptional regulator
MYFTRLPDHTNPGFDEQAHFNNFKRHNIIFNAMASKSYCKEHVGCLSFKTVLSGEEWYSVNNQQKAVRPGYFLILNDDQPYSSRIDTDDKVQSLSIFFKKEFASDVFYDALKGEEQSLSDPFQSADKVPEFFQTLYDIDSTLQQQLMRFISRLNFSGYQVDRVDEDLIFLLHRLVATHQSEAYRANRVNAVKAGTKKEIYKRLCVAKDLLHSTYMDKPNLAQISDTACLSVPQLVRQFKTVFQSTPHQYLTGIRLSRAAELLKQTNKSVSEITLMTGFENASAFCRAFRMHYAMSPLSFRANQN